ncbi:hypothetical protein [Listeria grayi]|uniref:hypothetical protein n=1 Tax=Listeria grayi TaxID=1641 RepID=UPI001623D637|nr:hypothetical protein [Listeria grayi]MBC1921469.1 hypothetical protein [Listeria grayi]
MQYIKLIIRIILAVILIAFGISDFLNGMFSSGAMVIDIWWNIILNDLIVQGIAYIAMGILFLVNIRWHRTIALVVTILFTVNAIVISSFLNDSTIYITQAVLLISLYLLMFIFRRNV